VEREHHPIDEVKLLRGPFSSETAAYFSRRSDTLMRCPACETYYHHATTAPGGSSDAMNSSPCHHLTRMSLDEVLRFLRSLIDAEESDPEYQELQRTVAGSSFGWLTGEATELEFHPVNNARAAIEAEYVHVHTLRENERDAERRRAKHVEVPEKNIVTAPAGNGRYVVDWCVTRPDSLDLGEVDETTHFDVLDVTTGQVMMSFSGRRYGWMQSGQVERTGADSVELDSDGEHVIVTERGQVRRMAIVSNEPTGGG
jgi:hypothetical protein